MLGRERRWFILKKKRERENKGEDERKMFLCKPRALIVYIM
jgi:hypothetical protein